MCLLKWKWATLLWMVRGVLDLNFYTYILFFFSGISSIIMSSDKLFSASNGKIVHNRADQWFPNVLLLKFYILRCLLWRSLKIHLALIPLVSPSFCLTSHCLYLKKELLFFLPFLSSHGNKVNMQLSRKLCSFEMLSLKTCKLLWAQRKIWIFVDIPLFSDIL